MTISLDSEEGESVVPTTAETPESLLIERSNQQMVQEAIEELPFIFREVDFAVRRGGNVLPGNCGNNFNSDWNGDVPLGESQECASRWG